MRFVFRTIYAFDREISFFQGDVNYESPIIRSSEFFNDLYHRFLLTPKIEMKCLCLQAMTIVYGRHFEDIGCFHDTKYIVAMLDRVSFVVIKR